MSGLMPKPSFRHSACRLCNLKPLPRCRSSTAQNHARPSGFYTVRLFPLLTWQNTTIYGLAADKPYIQTYRMPPGFPPGFVLPHTASHPIGMDSLPHTHPSRAVAVHLHPYRQVRGKSNAGERQNMTPASRHKEGEAGQPLLLMILSKATHCKIQARHKIKRAQ